MNARTQLSRLGVIASLCAAAFSLPAAHADAIDHAAMVAAHNKWRAQVGITEPLTYSPELAAKAQAWADNLKNKHHCGMHHSEADGRFGENLYWASALEWSDGHRETQAIPAELVVDSWGTEKSNYDYANNRCAYGKKCGHYTQMVWRATKSVGCAKAVCEDSHEQVWVCEYQPAGNWVGKKPY